MSEHAPAKEDSATQSGLPWPEAYLDLLPVMQQEWGIENAIYLTRRLSGKSGARVFPVDIVSGEFTGQAILKLARAPDPEWQERSEAQRQHLAFEAAPDYAAKHLPRLLHTLHHGSNMAILSSIAGRGLEFAIPWHQCPYDRQLEVIGRVSKDLLEGWNHGYTLVEGMQEPQTLLEGWLGYRLDAHEGRIHAFLAEICGLSPDEPSVSFEGHWYPNPLAFATKVLPLPDRVRLRAVKGIQHGDFHGFNLLVGSRPGAELKYYLIDLADYEDNQFLFFDHALFELNYLLFARERVGDENWESILDRLSYFRHHDGPEGLQGDDVGLIDLVRVLRRELLSWVDRHESNRLSYMESQYLLARVAAGLNFANKTISEKSRRKAFMYAAVNLKDFLKVNQVEWPKHGPAFSLREGARGSVSAPARPGADTPPVHVHTNPSLPGKPAIAVLAFENLSGDPEQEYFVDGVSLEILTLLSRADWLMVISRGSTFAYKGQAVDPKKVARELGVHYVVEGDVRKTGNRVRITVRLVDGCNGHSIWTERYERDLENVFALQDEIAQSIVGNIDSEVRSSEQELARQKSEPLGAWDQFQKGMWHLFKFTRKDTESARQQMTRLIESSPDFAVAHAALAVVELRSIAYATAEDPEKSLEQALHHATRAVALNDKSSFAHAVFGRVNMYLGDVDRAISECETAIALNPSSSLAYLSLTAALFWSGRAEEALPAIDMSMRLSPKGPLLTVKLVVKSLCLYSLGHLAEAENAALHAPHRREVGPYRRLALAAIYAHQDRLEDARAAVAKILEIREDMSLDVMRRFWQHANPQFMDMFLADLRKAGLAA